MAKLNHMITGHCGFIGGKLYNKFLRNGIKTTEGCDRQECDNISCLADSYDTIFHLAAYKSVAESMEDPVGYYRNNVARSIELLANNSFNKFVFVSSAAAHNPTNPYGRSKLMFEQILLDCVPPEKLAIVRPENVVGDETDTSSVIYLMREAKRSGTPMKLHKDTSRDFIHVDDVVEDIYNADKGMIHSGTGIPISIESLAIYCGVPYKLTGTPNGVLGISYAPVPKDKDRHNKAMAWIREYINS